MHTKLLNDILRKLSQYPDSSASVSKPGPDTPSQTEDARAAVLKALNDRISTVQGKINASNCRSRTIQVDGNRATFSQKDAVCRVTPGKQGLEEGPSVSELPIAAGSSQHGAVPDKEVAQAGDNILIVSVCSIPLHSEEIWWQVLHTQVQSALNKVPQRVSPLQQCPPPLATTRTLHLRQSPTRYRRG